MTRTGTSVVMVAAVLAAAAALTWVITHPARTAESAFPGTTTAAAPVSVSVPTSSAAPHASASSRAAAPTRTVTAAAAAAVAQPFIQSFADQPGVRPLKPLPSPTATISVAADVDGCDHAYGRPTQCIPWTFPAGTTDKCAWLAAHGYTDVKVVGADRQKLDPDGDKIACD